MISVIKSNTDIRLAMHVERRVAFQGERGAFGEEAVTLLWPNEAEPVPVPTFADVVCAVADGRVHAGVLPVENTIAGCIRESVAALAASDAVCMVGETIVPVTQCVMALEGARIEALTTVESHPMALAQCGDFLCRHPHITLVPAYDTAGAARNVASARDRRRAAIAGPNAALCYGLVILAKGIQDASENWTRFVAIARHLRAGRAVA